MSGIRVGFKRMTDGAFLPTKEHKEDSGFDLYASKDILITPGTTEVISTGISVSLPKGYEAQIRPRSGITSRTDLRVQLGTIDEGYTGELGIIADNRATKNSMKSIEVNTVDGGVIEAEYLRELDTIQIQKGDKVAQLVIQKIPEVSMYEIEGDLEETGRGGNGFGSTGV